MFWLKTSHLQAAE